MLRLEKITCLADNRCIDDIFSSNILFHISICFLKYVLKENLETSKGCSALVVQLVRIRESFIILLCNSSIFYCKTDHW